MRIQCNVCEGAEAKVLCCADEAALCWDCDQKVHAANKLATKHQRVPLSHPSSQMPKCDICQGTTGYFFCLEDRALLCRKCDVAIHTANPYVSGHQRFLLTGVKVGVGSTEGCVSTSINKSHSIGKASETYSSQSISRRKSEPSNAYEATGVLLGQFGRVETVPEPATYSTGDNTTTENNTPDWHLDDYLALTDFSPNDALMDDGSFSKLVVVSRKITSSTRTTKHQAACLSYQSFTRRSVSDCMITRPAVASVVKPKDRTKISDLLTKSCHTEVQKT